MDKILLQIAAELKVRPAQVNAAVDLLDGGATVPFIARYRKEATGGLDDVQLRELEERLGYLRELEERRAAVLKSIEEQGKLTPELRAAIEAAPTKQELEDLYLPYKPKRRTKGQIAREAGIEPLADKLFADPSLDPAAEAAAFVKTRKGRGRRGLHHRAGRARRRARHPVGALGRGRRRWCSNCANGCGPKGLFKSKLDGRQGREQRRRGQVPRLLRLRRADRPRAFAPRAGRVSRPAAGNPGRQAGAAGGARAGQALASPKARSRCTWAGATRAAPADDLLRKCVAWTWRVKLSLSTERDLFARLREEAEKVAIKVFADNLRDLLLAAPAGPRVVMGLDPGIRTGVKVAVVDATGKLVDTSTVYPHEPRRDWEGSLHQLGLLCRKHGVNLIAIGNGTASRETDKLAADLIKRHAADRAGMQRKVVVSEAGASVYSASEFASQEMPDVDVSLRGAASIARRLQDPLAELVKIDPKSHRRRPVPARREPERTGAHAGRGGGGLRELGGRGPEHGQRAAAVARVGAVGQRGQGGRALARGATARSEPPAADGSQRPGRQDLRAERGLPAHPRRRQPAGHDRRAPGNLSGGREDDGGDRQAGGGADGPRGHAQDAEARAVRQREVRRRSPSRTSWANWRSPAATRARISRWRASTTAWRTSPTCAKAWCWRAR